MTPLGLQAHLGDGVRHVLGLFRVQWGAVPGGVDCTELTSSGADVPHDHERGGASSPAFTDVWALSFLADRVQAQGSRTGLDRGIALLSRAAGEAYLEPIGFACGHAARINPRELLLVSVWVALLVSVGMAVGFLLLHSAHDPAFDLPNLFFGQVLSELDERGEVLFEQL